MLIWSGEIKLIKKTSFKHHAILMMQKERQYPATIQLEIKKPILVAMHQYELGLFQLSKSGVRERVYQLHVSPITKRSHNTATDPIYGPHVHYGCHVIKRLEQSIDENFENAFELYCEHINLVFTGNLNSPL